MGGKKGVCVKRREEHYNDLVTQVTIAEGKKIITAPQ